MKKIFLCFLSWVLVCQLGMSQDSPWYVRFFQDPNSAGLSTKFDVSPAGTAIPIDEFRKYNLEGGNGISEIRYKLPQGVALVCFTRRFLKSADGDISNFINNNKILRYATGHVGVRFGRDVLVLDGTGKDEVAQLWVIQGGKYDNKIRSAMLQKH
jgi:hypothetical protein